MRWSHSPSTHTRSACLMARHRRCQPCPAPGPRSSKTAMSTIRRPTIGVTLDSEQPGGYSKYPWYAIRQNYADAIVAAGGLPIALPHDASLAAEYLDRIDALVVTGGAFDVDPALYGDGDRHATVTLKEG